MKYQICNQPKGITIKLNLFVAFGNKILKSRPPLHRKGKNWLCSNVHKNWQCVEVAKNLIFKLTFMINARVKMQIQGGHLSR